MEENKGGWSSAFVPFHVALLSAFLQMTLSVCSVLFREKRIYISGWQVLKAREEEEKKALSNFAGRLRNPLFYPC